MKMVDGDNIMEDWEEDLENSETKCTRLSGEGRRFWRMTNIAILMVCNAAANV